MTLTAPQGEQYSKGITVGLYASKIMHAGKRKPKNKFTCITLLIFVADDFNQSINSLFSTLGWSKE